MTQAPTPGPLDSESVKLLVKGDLLRRTDNAIGQFERLSVSGLVVWNPYREKRDPSEILSFIGRPDGDGWMPWSGGENPVGEARVEVKFRDGSSDIQSGYEWNWDSEYAPIIAFRLAPTAPVEASGSEPMTEREIQQWIEACNHEPARQVLRDYLALRPQPSGETREDRLSAALIAMVEHFERVDAAPEDKAAIQAACEVWAGVKRDKALSTTPARAEAQDEDTPCTDCGDSGVTHQTERRCSCQEAEAQDEGALSVLDRLLNYSGARGSFDAMKHGDAVKDAEELLRSVKSPSHTDLMVTPESIDAYMKVNPMEAQDEGAAGEKGLEVDYDPTKHDGFYVHREGTSICWMKDGAFSIWVPYDPTHPSPTPAADADRVRIAVEALERIERISFADSEEETVARQALAALKSTAAKAEGK